MYPHRSRNASKWAAMSERLCQTVIPPRTFSVSICVKNSWTLVIAFTILHGASTSSHPTFSTPKGTPAANIPISDVKSLSELRGRITHFYTGALFHLFDEPTQYALALRVAALLKREPGAIVFGRHQGLAEAGYIDDHLGRYAHTVQTERSLTIWH